VCSNVDQGKETAAKKKKKSSKKLRHLFGDEQPTTNVNGHHNVSLRESDADARTSPVFDQREPTSGDGLDSHGEGRQRLLGPLPSLSPQNTSRRPADSYRRLADGEDGTGKLEPIGQPETLTTG